MFKDTREELKRLEAALLDEEETDDLAATRVIEPVLQEETADPDLLSAEYLDLLLEDDQSIGNTNHYANHANNYRTPRRVTVYNADRVDTEELSRELLDDAPQGSITGLVICACVLSAGILAVALWLLIRYGGAFL